MKPIPIVDLNIELKNSASPATNIHSSKVVAFSGGFRIPTAVMEEKKRMFGPPPSAQPKSDENAHLN